METGFVEVEGGKLYYETNGQGLALVLIHAGFLDCRMWDSQFQLYSKNYKTIRYDVRGYGRSDVAKAKFSDHKDLDALLTHQNVARATIIGVSNGGRIALDFAVEYPEKVESLILVSPGASGYKASGPEEERLWNEFEEQMKPQEVAVRDGRAADAVEMDVNAWASAQDPAGRQRVREIAMDNFHVNTDKPWQFVQIPNPPAFQRLSNIHVPTLFIVGDKDVRAQILTVDNLHSRIPGSAKVLIKGADHIPNMSTPEEFDRTVLEFLKQQAIQIQA
jgi:3-oxoadipate enol-lactonase